MHKAAAQYVGIVDGKIVCHTGVIQAPMRKNTKRVHRLVVLPDWQGVGIGTAFITEIARLYAAEGYAFSLITTTPALVGALKRKPVWYMTVACRQTNGYKAFSKNYGKLEHLTTTSAKTRFTYSFMYYDKKDMDTKN